jgi:signal transduction histidine kinase
LREAQRLRYEFLRDLSHELRSPLNAINGFAEILLRREIEPASPQYREFVGHILGGAHSLGRLIDNVLDFVDLEAGKLTFEPAPVALPELVNESLRALRTEIAEKRLQVETVFAPGLSDIELDRERLQRILDNLLANAAKFNREEGRIVVRAAPDGADAFVLEVEDSGIGIAAADLPRVFLPFGRLPGEPRQRRRAGARLGLALTKVLIEAQGGTIGVQSEPARGTRFFVRLPRRMARAQDSPPR